jgi:predicted 2-oxoglutarate/Fe(II)-dependent dioxygenase YbiX
MNVGDAVLYQGMKKLHWREKFEGKWQAQVFLHYVDANGPNAHLKMDKRDNLGNDYISDLLPTYMLYSNHITKDYCSRIQDEYIKKTYEKLKPEIEGGRVDTSIRNVERLMLPTTQGIGSTLTALGLNTNYKHWKYNVTHSEQCEFLHYQVSGKYVSHTDTRHSHTGSTRKLTVLLFLNDDFEGGKFYIQTGHEKEYPPQEPGTVIVFPSYMLHGVEPVIKGTRNAIVCWIEGPYILLKVNLVSINAFFAIIYSPFTIQQ